MSAFTSLILTQLTVPPGDLIYYIVLVFAVASALQSAFNHWRVSEFPQAKRAFIGLGVLLAAQVVMFVFSGLGWQRLINPTVILPPLDRAYILFGVVWIIWLYAFPEPNKAADAAAALLSAGILVAFGLSLLIWQPNAASISYNQTNDDWAWQIASLLTALIGIAILFIRKPDGMWNGIMLLSIGFLGHVGHFLFAVEGNYSGIVRLAYMAGYPILLTLPQRFAIPPAPVTLNVTPRPVTRKQDTLTGMPERRRYSTDPKTFHAMLALAEKGHVPIDRPGRQTNKRGPIAHALHFLQSVDQQRLVPGRIDGVVHECIRYLGMHIHRFEFLRIHAPEVRRWRSAKHFIQQPVRAGNGDREPGASRDCRHRGRPGQTTRVAGPGYFIEPLLELFVVRVDVYPELMRVLSFGLGKTDNVFNPAILHIAALRSRDRVAGAAHFQVDDARARGLMHELAAALPGYLLPRLVREVPGAAGKTPLT